MIVHRNPRRRSSERVELHRLPPPGSRACVVQLAAASEMFAAKPALSGCPAVWSQAALCYVGCVMAGDTPDAHVEGTATAAVAGAAAVIARRLCYVRNGAQDADTAQRGQQSCDASGTRPIVGAGATRDLSHEPCTS
jgi:hypothetical protein